MMSSGSGPPPASSPSTAAAVAHPPPAPSSSSSPQPHATTLQHHHHPTAAYHQQHQLRQAAARGDLATCRRLLATAAPPPPALPPPLSTTRCLRFSRDERGRSALHLAAAAGHSAVVRLLLTHAAVGEVDAPDGGGCAPLQRAAADGRDEVVHLLLAHGADADRQDGVHGNTALHEASWKGYSRTVRLLAAAGADLSKPNAGGFAALHLCCQNGHNQSCRELLLAGADPDSVNNYGDTALHTAARYGHAGVTRILISAQCRVSEVNKNGDTALHIASAMGRRKLTRILLEAGCDRMVRNKQGETARDIAVRKDLTEIVDILDESVGGPNNSSGFKRDKKSIKSSGKKQRSKSKVRFEGSGSGKRAGKDIVDSLEKVKHWSPYGCHYYPDPEAFPSPRLDSLPQEPLKKGEQYYLDLAGNIRKGPVGVGYTCYCAPLFRQLEARVERDKRELQRAQLRLGQRVQGLEQRLLLERGRGGRRSERAPVKEQQEVLLLPRSRSLEMLAEDVGDRRRQQLQPTRSMDELEGDNNEDSPTTTKPRPSVKELVARIQHQKPFNNYHHSNASTTAATAHQEGTAAREEGEDCGNNSESSDDEDNPLRMSKQHGPMGDSNLVQVLPNNYENLPPNDAPPRSRSGVYSPTIVNTSLLVDQTSRYVEPIVKVQEYHHQQHHQPGTSTSTAKYLVVDHPYGGGGGVEYYQQDLINPAKYYEHNSLNTRLAKLRVLDSANKSTAAQCLVDGTSTRSGMREVNNYGNVVQQQDNADRDTNNDSGYSTKVYGSSKGNSPSLTGQIIDGADCLGASSLV